MKRSDGLDQVLMFAEIFNPEIVHAIGDLVLRAISDRLMTSMPPTGIVARLSGDEFAIAVPANAIRHDVSHFAEQIGASFDEPLLAGTRYLRVRVSIGAAVFPSDGRTAAELLSNSHMALSRAKAVRRGGHVLFRDSIRNELEARLTLETELALAVERNEFELFYQPQLHLADSRLVGAEALIRWRHPTRGLISPAEFMPLKPGFLSGLEEMRTGDGRVLPPQLKDEVHREHARLPYVDGGERRRFVRASRRTG